MASDSDETQTSTLLSQEPMKRQMSGMGLGLLEGNFPPACGVPQPIINVIMYFTKAPSMECLKKAVDAHLLPLYRFASTAKDGHWVPMEKPLDHAYHFREVNVASEKAIDELVEEISPQPLDTERPLWQVVVIRAPARAVCLMRAHHCMGDGLGFLFAFAPALGVTGDKPLLATVPLPSVFLPPSVHGSREAERGQGAASKPGCFRSVFGAICGALLSAWRFVQGAIVPVTARYDDDCTLNQPLAERRKTMTYTGKRRYIRLPPTDLARVKRIGKHFGASVNDVLVAVLTGALRRYGAEVLGDERLQKPSQMLFKALMTVALPRPVDETDRNSSLCNRFNFASLQLPLGVHGARERLEKVRSNMDSLKSMALMMGSWMAAKLVMSVMPRRLNQNTVLELFSKHSLVCANVPGPGVPMKWPAEGGEIVEEVHMAFPNLISQVSMLSYSGQVHVALTVDPDLWRQAESIGKAWAQELNDLETAMSKAA